MVDPGWPWTSKISMEVLLLEGNSSSFQLNGYCISESKILRRMIFINGSRRGEYYTTHGIESNVMESIRFMSVLWLIFVKNFVLKFKIYFLKYFEIFLWKKFWNFYFGWNFEIFFSLFKHEKIIRRFRVNKWYLKVLSLGSLLNTIDPIKWEFRI